MKERLLLLIAFLPLVTPVPVMVYNLGSLEPDETSIVLKTDFTQQTQGQVHQFIFSHSTQSEALIEFKNASQPILVLQVFE